MNIGTKLGQCMLCGQNVKDKERYIVSEDGYCHKSCLNGSEIMA